MARFVVAGGRKVTLTDARAVLADCERRAELGRLYGWKPWITKFERKARWWRARIEAVE